MQFKVSYCLENIFFFGANWFYCIKYYETASDIEKMLKEESNQSQTQARKRRCLIMRWCVFAVATLACILSTVGTLDNNLTSGEKLTFKVSFLALFAVMIFAIITFISLGLIKFIGIVSRTQN